MSEVVSYEWYKRIAKSMKSLVTANGGVIVIESASVRPLLAEQDEYMKECPGITLEHFTLSLRRQDLSSRAFEGRSREVLVIFDHTRFNEPEARQVWEERALEPFRVRNDVMTAVSA